MKQKIILLNMMENRIKLKKTSLYNQHIKLNAKIISYAGFQMPLYYNSSIIEHISVRNHAGIFDISHMGKFIIKGKNSNDIIQYLMTNDISKISVGMGQYTCLVNEKGKIIDDLIIYKKCDNEFILIVNAININKDKNWIKNHISRKNNIELIDISNEYSLLSIQGPKTFHYIQQLTNIILEKIPFYHFRIGEFCNEKNIFLSRTGYTGSKGIEILIPNKKIIEVWNEILKIKKNGKNITPCGISSRDSLRLEMGYRLYGQDISEEYTPIEAGLSWIVKFNKRKFISKNILEKQFKEKFLLKKFLSFHVNGNSIPRKNFSLIKKNGHKIGYVTSGNFSPILKKGIGLGYLYPKVNIDLKNKNSIWMITNNNKKISISRKKIPFVKI